MEIKTWILSRVRGKPTNEMESEVIAFQRLVDELRDRKTSLARFVEAYPEAMRLWHAYAERGIGLMKPEDLPKLRRWELKPLEGKPRGQVEESLLDLQHWVSHLPDLAGTDEFRDCYKAVSALWCKFWSRGVVVLKPGELRQFRRMHQLAQTYLPCDSKQSRKFWHEYWLLEGELFPDQRGKNKGRRPDPAKVAAMTDGLRRHWMETRKLSGKMICSASVLQVIDELASRVCKTKEVPGRATTFRTADVCASAA